MRKSIDGLFVHVQHALVADPYSGHLFVFLGKRRDKVKVLAWDGGGFLLLYKRLEAGRFRMPEVAEDATCVQLDATQLAMLLDGIDVSRVRRPLKWQPPEQPMPGAASGATRR
ncbi:transposase [Corallococcus llansteffanensis]|uniref:Transposase n=2 Tax=Corallococcus llansteffanensis TaxID=2316731 RepID=A0A3A8Q4A0_9BACT|nr:transposase [Corallococcus llansteffanensis]